jgi:hypothetical protein
MTDQLTEELRTAERRLQAAMLAGDVAVLDELLDDRLLHTGGPDGALYTKADDLRMHRTRQMVMTAVDEQELRLLVDGRTGVTWFLGTLAGSFDGTPFTARVRFTRFWLHGDRGWRIVAAHASPA